MTASPGPLVISEPEYRLHLSQLVWVVWAEAINLQQVNIGQGWTKLHKKKSLLQPVDIRSCKKRRILHKF